MTRRRRIGVIGAGTASPAGYALAREVGRLIAARGATLVCGGLGGIMEAACRGCRENGGLTLGVLPGERAAEANRWVEVPVVTGLGHARNIVIAQTAEALIAVEGEYGTVSEMAIALKLGRPVITLRQRHPLEGTRPADSPAEAVRLAWEALAIANRNKEDPHDR